ncbi:glycosyltransferase [Agrococcus sp. DT81.2]|uniref:glycosyltransferase n=1 Tax=Agrococcus sp. DT81.2 TaxID=3393414 RepID=UPI003CE4AF64
MATIAAYMSPSVGHLYPFVGVLLELQARGHRIHFRTLKREVPRMRELGFEVDAIDPRLERVELDDWRSRPLREGLLSMVDTLARRAELGAPDLQSLIDAVDPDLVITDINAWGGAVAAEASGLPWVAMSPYSPFVRSSGLPPPGPGFRPDPSSRGRLRDATVRRLVLDPAERLMVRRRNDLRARLAGLPPLASADELFRRPDVTLVATAEPLEYRHDDWAPDLQLVGDTSWEPPTPMPTWFDEIDGPIVLVTTSSEFQRDSAIVCTAFEALADEPVTVIATMPAGIQPGIRVPANGRLVEFLPHRPVLDRAVCAITHGGMGVTQKALARGVPVVTVPWGRDQFEVAARVEHAGAGVRVARSALSPQRLRDAVAQAQGMRAGVEAVAAGLAAAGGPALAATLVEQRLRQHAQD